MRTTKTFFMLTIVGFLLVACSAPEKPQPTMTATEVIIISSPTPIIKASQTPLPTVISTNTPIPTWTPLPTLTTKQANEKINGLNSSNGGCQLPCWWGIVPNKTKISEAIHLLTPFSEIKQGESVSFLEDGKKHFATNFELYYDVPSKTESWRLLFSVKDELITDIDVLPPDTEYNFKLHQLLAVFGKPEQIYVSAQPESQTNVLEPARIILEYSNLGIWAAYEFPLAKAGKILKICPQPVGARLSLWDPNIKNNQRISIEEFVNRITGFGPHKVEDVSKMSIQSFYDVFKNPNSTACLETSIDLWP